MEKFNNFIDFVKIHPIKTIIIFVFTGIITQTVVQVLYLLGKLCPIFITNISEADSLNYWGNYISSLIGAVIAIVGVYITIQSSQNQTKSIIENGTETTKEVINSNRKDIDESNRKSVLPIIIINRLMKKYNDEDGDDLKEEVHVKHMKYEEKNIENFIFVISQNKIDFTHELTKQQEIRTKNIIEVYEEPNVKSFVPVDCYYMPMNICNVGLGPAVNTSFTLIKDGFKGNDDYHITSFALSLKTNHDMKLAFIIDKPKLCIGKYILDITYSDMFSNKYIQSHKLEVKEKKIEFNLEINQQFLGSE